LIVLEISPLMKVERKTKGGEGHGDGEGFSYSFGGVQGSRRKWMVEEDSLLYVTHFS
jgi:hypothetical protein